MNLTKEEIRYLIRTLANARAEGIHTPEDFTHYLQFNESRINKDADKYKAEANKALLVNRPGKSNSLLKISKNLRSYAFLAKQVYSKILKSRNIQLK